MLRTVLDQRRPYEIRLTNGGVWQGQMKYVDATFSVALRGEVDGVVLRFYHAEARRYRTVSYAIPLSCFLWRKATVFFAADLASEGAEHVNFEAVREPDAVLGVSTVEVRIT
jgi:hypothetical protein